MRKRCKSNYIEAIGAVYWAKKTLFSKNLREVVTTPPPLRRTRVNMTEIMGGQVGAAVVPVPFTNAARVRFPVGSESYVNLVLDPYLPAQVFSEHFGFLLHLKSYLLSIFLSSSFLAASLKFSA